MLLFRFFFMLFSKVTGQQDIKSRLIQSVKEGRISHAQLFTGEDGYGTLPMALAFAQYILCENRQDGDACGSCPSCEKVKKLVHPDLHLVFPVTTGMGAKNPKSDDFIGQWREAVLEQPYLNARQWYSFLGQENKQGMIYKHESDALLKKMSLKTYESDHKLVIIWQAERMNLAFANKMLKMLEEPPPGTIFILVSSHPEILLPTIISRVQSLKLPPLKNEDIRSYIEKNYGLPKEDAVNVSRLAGGDLTRAIEYLGSYEEKDIMLDLFIRWMRLAYKKDIINMTAWTEEMAAAGREKIKQFFIYALRMVRENFLLNQMPEHSAIMVKMAGDEAEFSNKFARFINQDNIFRLVEEIERAGRDIESNAYQKTVLLDLSIKAMGLIAPRKGAK